MNKALPVAVVLGGQALAGLGGSGSSLSFAAGPTNSPSLAPSSVFDPNAVFERARPAVVVLLPDDPRGRPKSKGTGFLISGEGLLATARHVMAGANGMHAITSEARKLPVTGFVGEDADHDVVVLKLDGRALPFLPLAAEDLPQHGQWVSLVGNPGGGGLAFPTGAVAGVSGIQDVWEDVLTTIPVRGGHSGSPMLNERGEVVGLAVAATADKNGVAMPVKVIKRILARAGTNAPMPFASRPRKGSGATLAMDKDFRAGREAMQRQAWATAEPLLRKVTQRFSDSPAAQMYFGYNCVQQRSWKDAVAAFRQALKYREDSPVLWFFYGTSLVADHQTADGTGALRKAIELQLADPVQLASAWSTLALVAAGRHHEAEARTALAQVRRLDADRADRLQVELWRLYPLLTVPAPAIGD